jgi:hypothetical protein
MPPGIWVRKVLLGQPFPATMGKGRPQPSAGPGAAR